MRRGHEVARPDERQGAVRFGVGETGGRVGDGAPGPQGRRRAQLACINAVAPAGGLRGADNSDRRHPRRLTRDEGEEAEHLALDRAGGRGAAGGGQPVTFMTLVHRLQQFVGEGNAEIELRARVEDAKRDVVKRRLIRGRLGGIGVAGRGAAALHLAGAIGHAALAHALHDDMAVDGLRPGGRRVVFDGFGQLRQLERVAGETGIREVGASAAATPAGSRSKNRTTNRIGAFRDMRGLHVQCKQALGTGWQQGNAGAGG